MPTSYNQLVADVSLLVAFRIFSHLFAHAQGRIVLAGSGGVILPIIKPCSSNTNCISRATREFDIPSTGGSKDVTFNVLNSNNCTGGFEIIAEMVNVGALRSVSCRVDV